MNFQIIFYIIGYVMKIEGILMAFPFVTSLIYREKAAWTYLICGAAIALCGILITLKKPKNQTFYAKEGYSKDGTPHYTRPEGYVVRGAYAVKETRGSRIYLADVNTGKQRQISLDGLFISIGRQPETALFRGQLDLDDKGYIVADETTHTSVPGVFAAGDVRTKAVRQIVTATADGAVAAHMAEEYLLSRS